MKTLATLTSILMLFSFSCAIAPAALVAVEFSGRVTGSELGQRRGTRVFGYFIFEPGVPSGLQAANPPNLVVEATDTTYFERSSYSFYVYNNWLRESDFVLLDGFALELGVNWATLTNIPPSMEHIVLINDLSPVVGNRFYRVRRD
ncbi:MAG TPA: hypothetical protein VJS65_02685 [Verrucomicrobiae bacterium]|nr:hypothetical protein [Verrucomicrobiae bacterium]